MEKQYAAAVRLLKAAQKLAPSNPAVIKDLLAAEKALADDDTQNTKLADYKKHMVEAKTALDATRWADADKAYTAALELMPDDLEALAGQKEARRKLAALGVPDAPKNKFDELLDGARRSQTNKRYKEAIATLQQALNLKKNDPEATKLLGAARDSLKLAQKENARTLADATLAARMGKTADAKKLCDQALSNWPEDDKAEKLQKGIDQLLALADAALANYQKLMLAGSIAMNAKRYADAVTAFTAALTQVPGDPVAVICLAEAQDALKPLLAYNQLMNAGKAALARSAWTTAIKAFNDALKIVPGDPAAIDGRNQARFGRAMALGRAALAKKDKSTAVNAFKAALNANPGDPQALNLLQQAQKLRGR
jgi:tetratricopeptide (TPR) repeat protein